LGDFSKRTSWVSSGGRSGTACRAPTEENVTIYLLEIIGLALILFLLAIGRHESEIAPQKTAK
jgi:hypothetical protein